MVKAYLMLEDGTMLEGVSSGADGLELGRAVFNTDSGGYNAVLTDPAHLGEVVCMTYPIIGAYGINFDDCEKTRPYVSGLVARSVVERPSNWRSGLSLPEYLRQSGTVCISGVDTRALTRYIRDHGEQRCAVWTENAEVSFGDLKKMISGHKRPETPADTVVCRSEAFVSLGDARFKAAVVDLGSANVLCRALSSLGFDITLCPPGFDILSLSPDGVIFSNGPEGAHALDGLLEQARAVIESGTPALGIGEGFRLLAHLAGGSFMSGGRPHRGANIPVTDISQNRTYITSQNHAGHLELSSLDVATAHVSHRNLSDGAAEGLRFNSLPVFGVQFIPDINTRYLGSGHVLKEFESMMTERRANACR